MHAAAEAAFVGRHRGRKQQRWSPAAAPIVSQFMCMSGGKAVWNVWLYWFVCSRPLLGGLACCAGISACTDVPAHLGGSTAVQILPQQSLHSQTTVECHSCNLHQVHGWGGTALSLLWRSCAVVQARACCHVGRCLNMCTKQPLAAVGIRKVSPIPL
jgi:hypothetical protein